MHYLTGLPSPPVAVADAGYGDAGGLRHGLSTRGIQTHLARIIGTCPTCNTASLGTTPETANDHDGAPLSTPPRTASTSCNVTLNDHYIRTYSWLRTIAKTDFETYAAINAALDELASVGPGLGRPLVDTMQGSTIHNLKELRPRSGGRVSIRILFVFDPWSRAVLLVGGNKAGNWKDWYKDAIRRAEQLYEVWLAQQKEDTGEGHHASDRERRH